MGNRKLKKPVSLLAKVEEEQYDTLRIIAFKEKKSIGEIVRGAVDAYLKIKSGHSETPGLIGIQ